MDSSDIKEYASDDIFEVITDLLLSSSDDKTNPQDGSIPG
ncbi:hypothetical protein BWQ96_07501 [Gracilariopsis chorda]|uniref:Uncharacterized protein n=1 Tax=Gracilariopsis chorda TaxID=448386 RepID=A0A2V3IL44_9FLOR|nr:hypothetical protein BWQ96_07501 [Gracilariopsis chorda]|eukprot:PXF42794.1 hypothetical protein BWQ96_07501 [Gracilariopsis chorda]